MLTSTDQFTQEALSTHQRMQGKRCVKQDIKNLKSINFKDDLIKAYPDQLGSCQVFITHISERMYVCILVVRTPKKYPIVIRPLVHKKLDKLLEYGVIVIVTEPMD